MNSEELTKTADLQGIATKGAKIYEEIKSQFEPGFNGKFLAIDVDTRKTYIADTSANAVVKAREQHPNKVFYVVKIGYDAAETLAHFFANK